MQRLFRIRAHDMLQQCNVIWTIADFVRIEGARVSAESMGAASSDEISYSDNSGDPLTRVSGLAARAYAVFVSLERTHESTCDG
jgi:hypothetical protein